MIINFDLSLLERFQRDSLKKMLDVIQSENKNEIVVFAVKLPYKFMVLTDKKVEFLEGLGCKKSDCPVCLGETRKPSRAELVEALEVVCVMLLGGG